MKRTDLALPMFLLLVALTPFSLAQTYSITDLNTLGGFESKAWAINDRGDVVGYYSPAQPPQHAFLWTRAAGIKDLTPNAGELTTGYAVNARDEVAVYAFNQTVWSAVDVKNVDNMINLGVYTVPQGINSSGTIVGNNSVTNHAFQWTAAGGMQDLGTLGGAVSQAAAINDSGQVAGYSDVASGPGHAFLWTQQTGMSDLGTLHDGAQATSISRSGQVAGYYWVKFSQFPFLWTTAGGLQEITPLPNTQTATAVGVNDAGQVVGCAILSNNTEAGFLWTRSAGSQDLLSLIPDKKNFTQVCPTAINNAGQIAGVAETTNFTFHAVLLTPIKQ